MEAYSDILEQLLRSDMTVMVPTLLIQTLGGLSGIAVYVMTAIALYSIARRRELNHPWMAWIPVLNLWLLGSLSDQYQYVTRRENKAKRKVLLILELLTMAVSIAICAVAVGMVIRVIPAVRDIAMAHEFNEVEIIRSIGSPLLVILGLTLPLMGLSISFSVLRYMALYDVFASCEPRNKTLYLILSIVGAVLLRNLLEPIFLLVVKGKDEGMPPRRPAPGYNPYTVRYDPTTGAPIYPSQYPPQPVPQYPPQSIPQQEPAPQAPCQMPMSQPEPADSQPQQGWQSTQEPQAGLSWNTEE